MKQIIKLTENQLYKIINESVKMVLKENENEPEKFVNWDDITYYWNYGSDFVEKNREKSDRMGVPYDCRCDLCQKALKDGYKTVYWREPSEEESNDGGSSTRFYLKNVPGTKPSKIGKTCYKAVAKAFKDKYGDAV